MSDIVFNSFCLGDGPGFVLSTGEDKLYLLSRDVFLATARLLPYRNGRVRLLATRVLGRFLRCMKIRPLSVNARRVPLQQLESTDQQHGIMTKLALLLCMQLDDTYLDDATAKYVVKNFLYIIQTMILAPHLFDDVSDTLSRGKSAGTEGCTPTCSQNSPNPIGWLVGRLSEAARHTAPISCTVIFQCYGIIVTCTRDDERLKPLIPLMMSTVSKTLSSIDHPGYNIERQQHMKRLAHEIIKMLGHYV